METVVKESLWKQFGASMDTFKHVLQLCPDDYWYTHDRFFYISYHCLIFLDYYLTVPAGSFSTPFPYTITAAAAIPAEAVDDVVPNRRYTKQEMLHYLQTCYLKCHALIGGVSEEQLTQKWIAHPDELSAAATLQYSVFEILLYNMRHVEHHSTQLNLLLRQDMNTAADWLAVAEQNIQ